MDFGGGTWLLGCIWRERGVLAGASICSKTFQSQLQSHSTIYKPNQDNTTVSAYYIEKCPVSRGLLLIPRKVIAEPLTYHQHQSNPPSHKQQTALTKT